MHDDMLGGEWDWEDAEEDGKILDKVNRADKDSQSKTAPKADTKPLSPAGRAKAAKTIRGRRNPERNRPG